MSHVIDYWEVKLGHEVSQLSSLQFFKAEFCSLASPHPILWTPGANPYEVSKAVIQLRMLSGRYRTSVLTKHWSSDRTGSCPAPDCTDQETIEHFLVICPFYNQYRAKLKKLWQDTKTPILNDLVTAVLTYPSHDLLQFILDASVHPLMISYVQTYGNELLPEVFHLTRTWCYIILFTKQD